MTDTRAEWLETTQVGTKVLPERIRLNSCHSWREVAFMSDWIVQRQDGSFEVLRPEMFMADGYVQV